MPDNELLEKSVQSLLSDLCKVLRDHGYQETSIGALMRVIGIPEDKASAYDDRVVDLDEHLARTTISNVKIPPGTVFH